MSRVLLFPLIDKTTRGKAIEMFILNNITLDWFDTSDIVLALESLWMRMLHIMKSNSFFFFPNAFLCIWWAIIP